MNDHPIPAISRECLGGRMQPSRDNIDVTDEFAIMSNSSFLLLPTQRPAGIFQRTPGKMWKFFDESSKRWFLQWYGRRAEVLERAIRIVPGARRHNNPIPAAEISEWLEARIRGAGGSIDDIKAFGEECVRWAERSHGINFNE